MRMETEGVGRCSEQKSSRNLKSKVARWFMCGEVVGGEAREEGGATPCGFSPEGTGEPWKDFEQGRGMGECILWEVPSGCCWRMGPESGAPGGGWVGSSVGEMRLGQAGLWGERAKD